MENLRKSALTATVALSFTDEELEDIFVTALEGGIGYWAVLCNDTEDWNKAYETYKDEPTSIIAKKLVIDEGKSLVFEDNEYDESDPDAEPERWTLDADKLKKGLDLYYRQYGNVKQELDHGSFDAECADCLIQLAMFGEIVFG